MVLLRDINLMEVNKKRLLRSVLEGFKCMTSLKSLKIWMINFFFKNFFFKKSMLEAKQSVKKFHWLKKIVLGSWEI